MLSAETTDTYFVHTKRVLDSAGLNKEVVAEVYARGLPYPGVWGVLTGVYEVAKLLRGLPVDVWAMDEGSVFLADSSKAFYEPVMVIRGRYTDFAKYENPILGLITSSTSVSSYAARIKAAANGKLVFSFGTRRVHPALAPTVERACYIAGFDGVSNTLGAKLLSITPVGTMPHALVQLAGSQEEAWRLFDRFADPSIPRVALVDTYWDEKAEAAAAFKALGSRLWGVRLDTPASRRGDFKKIIEEVRWELNIRGGGSVKLIVSGGLDESSVAELAPLVDGFGVGTSVAHPPLIDFSLKIVEASGASDPYVAKRGVLSGEKQVYRAQGFRDTVTLRRAQAKGLGEPLLKPLLSNGTPVRRIEDIHRLRSRVLSQIAEVSKAQPSLRAES